MKEEILNTIDNLEKAVLDTLSEPCAANHELMDQWFTKLRDLVDYLPNLGGTINFTNDIIRNKSCFY